MMNRRQSKPLHRSRRFGLKLLAVSLGVILLAASALLFAGNSWGLTPSVLLGQSLPRKDALPVDFPEHYLIEAPNYFEQQGTNQCGGFASAFVLRHFGQEAAGTDIYDRLGDKLSSGYVLPQAILDYFNAADYQAALVRSDLSQLKTRVAQGDPMIILMGQGGSWQHYAVVVGYDAETIYLFDSLKQTVRDNPYYNRSMTTDYFEQLWNNGLPFFERACFAIKKPEATDETVL